MIHSKSHSGSHRFLKSLFSCSLALAFAVASASAFALPAFNKSFSPNTMGPGSTASLVFTITNDTNSVNSLSFSDTMPAGLVIATLANAKESCEGSISAASGGSTITLNGGRLAANQSCQIRVNVTGASLGTYTNVSGDLTSSSGNSGNATADLTIITTRLGLAKLSHLALFL
jgi:hypothetical protein